MSTEVQIARIEEHVNFIKTEIGEIKTLLSQHVKDDRNNFDSLRSELNKSENFMSFAKGKLSGVTLVVLVLWNVVKEFFLSHH